MTISTMKNANAAVQFAADQPATLERLANHGNPAVRRAANMMAQIAANHARNCYDATNHKFADDALYYLPMAEIEQLVKAYDAR